MKKQARRRRRALVALAVTAGAVAVTAVVPALAGDGPLSPELREVRAEVGKYHSFEQATRDGYTVEGEPCIASPTGTMGVHAVNAALLMDDAIDPRRPEILLYVPKGDGKLELVGVEYWKADADQSLATAGDRPALFGRTFDGPMPGHNPQMPVHYDLHVWVAEANPSGLFALFNPAVSC
jgi:hypothetical protein